MKKLIVTFSMLFIVLLIVRFVFEYYVPAVPVFGVLLTPLTWLIVAVGVLAVVFIVLTIYKELKGKPKDKGADEK